MKQYFSLFLICVCLPVTAGDKVDQTLAAEKNGIVEIHNVRGSITIDGWQNEQVKVTGTLDDMAEEFIFTTVGEKTLIKVKLPRNSSFHHRDGSDLKISVPQGSKIAFSGVATDLTVKSIDGGLEINSVSGDILVENTKGRTYINSVSGDLKLQTIDGILEISTVSGDLEADVTCKNVRVSGVSADINLKLQNIESASLSNVSGNTTVSGELMADGELKMGSVSGEAYYLVQGNLNATVSMETAPGGDIVNEYTDDKPISSFINSHNLRFTVGTGNGVIRMSTVSGNIGLKTR